MEQRGVIYNCTELWEEIHSEVEIQDSDKIRLSVEAPRLFIHWADQRNFRPLIVSSDSSVDVSLSLIRWPNLGQ